MREYTDIAVYNEIREDEPLVRQAITNTKNNFETICFPLYKELWNKLQMLSMKNESSRFLIMLAAFQVLLDRYNYDEDIVIRNADEHSLHKVPFHTKGEMRFTTLLSRLKGSISTPGEEVLGSPGDASLSKAVFIMQHTLELPVELSAAAMERDVTFDLAFIIANAAFPQLVVKFNISIYTVDMIRQMVGNYIELLHSILKQPSQKIGALPMLTAYERHKLLDIFNHTERPYPSGKTIVDLFEEQVNKTPSNIALYTGVDAMTYAALNEKANRLARYLVALGVKKKDNVGLLATRGFDMITGLFAILKAGAAYVPVEPSYPAERQQYILSQSSTKYILSNVDWSPGDASLKNIDMRTVEYDKYTNGNLGIEIDNRQLAYTIYTSGSTGVPKGVMIEHQSVVNLITWVNKEFKVGVNDRLLFITSICFDLSVYDIFGMLSAGGAIVIASKEDVLDTPKLADLLQKFGVTFWDSVPTTMDYLVSRLATYPGYRQNSLRLVFLSGDWIPVCLPEKIGKFFPHAHVVSLGGATEGTVWSNYYPITQVDNKWNSIPYGKPIANNSFYILNEQLQPVPCGVKGELYIGGVGVAKGYANDPEKTKNAFLPDPFTKKWGGRMYRTGDIGRMLPDGNMEFIGRKDNQVKIYGHRVELNEIECVIRECNTVSSAIVLYDDSKKQLVGYIVPGEYYDKDTVIAHIRRKLPDYMVPARWMELSLMPLTTNGKVDTKALRDINAQENLKKEFVAPRNELEISLATVWQQVLNIAEVGIHNNFFDMGGQSLVAVELITEMEKRVGKQLPVNILYKHPTIAQLSSFIQENTVNRWKSLVPVRSSGNKTPLYIVHGDGLSISNFQNLADYLDMDQPVYSLHPKGLNGIEAPLESIHEIAKYYVAEILEHNPSGPYVLGGYSFGGYIAIEMKKQLESIAKKVKMLAIFDTNAENVTYKENWKKTFFKRAKRQLPKFFFIVKSLLTRPVATIKYQYCYFSKKVNNALYKCGIKTKPIPQKGVNVHIDKITETNLKAFRNFDLCPFDDKIHLFKARSRMYFVDDFEYLGWTNYAKKGVSVYEVPGDHSSIFLPPNVGEMGRMLQHVLDNC